MIQSGLPWPFEFNVPSYISGQLGNVYYTVYDSTGSIYLSRRNTNVYVTNTGAYLVNLTFPSEGGYSIHWDITGFNFVGNEEILVFNFRTTTVYYTGYGQ
jgi:hypothetical protein